MLKKKIFEKLHYSHDRCVHSSFALTGLGIDNISIKASFTKV